jgi:hypothetical protein
MPVLVKADRRLALLYDRPFLPPLPPVDGVVEGVELAAEEAGAADEAGAPP